MELVRLFVAVELEAAVARAVDDVRRTLTAANAWLGARALRWVDAAQVHLTLRFVGEVTPEVGEALSRALDTTVPVAPFALTLGRPGWLPGPARPRVLTFDAVSGADDLRRVHAFVERLVTGAGIAADSRAFVPHVTLARVRDEWARRVRAEAARVESCLRERAPVTTAVREVTLFESLLTPRGAVHTPRRRAPLVAG